MGIFDAIGNVISTGLNLYGANKQNAAAEHNARMSEDFSERMSSTSFQRGVKDMQAAGLNPMLAYQQGGASTPQGVNAPVVNEMAGAATSAGSVVKDVAEIEAVRAQTKKAESEASVNVAALPRIVAETRMSNASAAAVEEQLKQMFPWLVKKSEHEAWQAQSNTAIKNVEENLAGWRNQYGELQARQESESRTARLREDVASATGAELGLSKERAYSGFYESDYGKASPYVESAGSVLNSAGTALGMMRRFNYHDYRRGR